MPVRFHRRRNTHPNHSCGGEEKVLHDFMTTKGSMRLYNKKERNLREEEG